MAAIARLRVALCEIEPEIWRQFDVPASVTLKQLHDVIQAAFAWQDYHLFEFEVSGRRYGIPDDEAGDGPGQVRDARAIRLDRLIARGATSLDYAYDFGDDWHHRVTIEAVEERPEDRGWPRFVDGARRAPPEDCGGPFGFAAFLAAIADPNHARHDELLRWHGGAFDSEKMDVAAIRRRFAMAARHLDAAFARRRPRGGKA